MAVIPPRLISPVLGNKPSVPAILKLSADKPEEKIHYYLSSWKDKIAKVHASLGETRQGAQMFEETDKKICLPRNWEQLVESSTLFLVMEKSMSIIGVDRVFDEHDWVDNIVTTTDLSLFLDGCAVSLEEHQLTKDNFSSSSKLELGRLEGQHRRAIVKLSQNKLPMKWTQFGKFKADASCTPADSFYKVIKPCINSRGYSDKIASLATRLFTRAQAVLSKDKLCEFKISRHILSFDEAWNMMGEIKKDAAGKVKYDKSGRARRYHPELPKFSGMTKDELIYVKVNWANNWSNLNQLTDLWKAVDNSTKYNACVRLMQRLYASRLKAVKSVKAYADSRLEGLGVPRNAAKPMIASRINQRVAAGTYEPKFTKVELEVVNNTLGEEAKASFAEYVDAITPKPVEEHKESPAVEQVLPLIKKTTFASAAGKPAVKA